MKYNYNLYNKLVFKKHNKLTKEFNIYAKSKGVRRSRRNRINKINQTLRRSNRNVTKKLYY